MDYLNPIRPLFSLDQLVLILFPELQKRLGYQQHHGAGRPQKVKDEGRGRRREVIVSWFTGKLNPKLRMIKSANSAKLVMVTKWELVWVSCL